MATVKEVSCKVCQWQLGRKGEVSIVTTHQPAVEVEVEAVAPAQTSFRAATRTLEGGAKRLGLGSLPMEGPAADNPKDDKT